MPHTLLLADDSVTIQRVIELTFADEDVQVIAVGDGDEAIAALAAHPPDIVLADVGMPGKNGYEVARHMKADPRLARIPVVLLTGAFEPVDQAAAAAAGCDGVLAKPFEPQLVISRVRELLGRSHAEPAATRQPPVAPPPPAEPPARAAAADADIPPMPAPRIDDYFDRLDQAFAAFSNRRADTPEPATVMSSAAAAAPSAPGAAAEAGTTLPPLAQAFSALLAAERHTPASAAAPNWPDSPPAPAPLLVTEEMMAEVVRRVLDRLSDRVVRETASQIVPAVAERMIREEIDKIKAAIR